MSDYSCKDIALLMNDWFSETLTHEQVCAIVNHLAGCEHCSLLFAHTVSMDTLCGARAKVASFDQHNSFIDSVIAQTSGSICDQAEILISETVDEVPVSNPIHSSDNYLLNKHLKKCQQCSDLSSLLPTVVKAVRSEPVYYPDDRFIDDVLMATSQSMEGTAINLTRKVINWCNTTLLNRPRIAAEFAYVVTLVFILVCYWVDMPVSKASIPFKASQTAVIDVSNQIDTTLSDLSGQVQDSYASKSHQVSLRKQSIASHGRTAVDNSRKWILNGAEKTWSTILRYGTRLMGWFFNNTEVPNGKQSGNATNA